MSAAMNAADVAAQRLAAVRTALAEREVAALLVTRPANVRWLSGFTAPEDARVLVTADDAWLFTDGRYTAQAAETSVLPAVIDRSWRTEVAARLPSGALAVEAEHLTLAGAAALAKATDREPVRTDGLIAHLRRRKDATEIDAIRRAAELTDRAYAHVLTHLAPGVREVDLALEIERFVRSEGGDGMAFDVIVASGVRSAMPHGVASPKVVEAGDLVTFDLGARVDGYCADMTRTVGVGDVAPAHRALFGAVLEAQEAAVAAVAPGATAHEVDAVARTVLARHGQGDAFVHSLGHGVGLEIHEGPGLAPRADDVLEPGMVVTVEPGAYHPGDAGVRIEDLVVVTDAGAEVLSRSPKGWTTVPDAAA